MPRRWPRRPAGAASRSSSRRSGCARSSALAGNLRIECKCGALRGVARGLSRGDSNRAICHCDDCQAFARFLGRADDVLDAHGGTDVFQISPARLAISSGAERIRCVRLTEKGLYRWYAGCCRTPIGNTLPARPLPFVGVVHACVEGGANRDAIDLAVGPPRARVWGRFATGDASGLDKLYTIAPPGMLLRVGALIVKWRLRGDHKRSPFFDAATGEPIAAPHVLTEAERAEVLGARDRARR